MAAAHSSLMACPRTANNKLLTMELLGRASSVSMANARCTLLRSSSSSSSCRRRSSTSTSPLCSKRKVRPNPNFSPWRSRLSPMGTMSSVDLKLLNGGPAGGVLSPELAWIPLWKPWLIKPSQVANLVVTCRLTSEQADSVTVSTLPPSNDGRAEEIVKVVEIMRQSLLSVLEQLEALVRQKETIDGSTNSSHNREVVSDSAIASALKAVETIGSSVNGDRIEREKDLESPRSRMEFRKRIQKREAKRSLTGNVGLKKQNVKLNEATAAIKGIREEDEKFMGEALVEAKKAAMAGEVPVGAVIVQKGKIIARAYNRVESDADPTAHAEMLCLRSAARHHGDWRLMDATLYVTLEPCPMCAGAILQSRVKGLVWGSRNTLLGADGSWVSLFPELIEEEMDTEYEKSENEVCNGPFTHPFHTSLEVRRQVLADECSTVMRSFFKARRTLKVHFLKTKPRWLPLLAWVLFKRILTWLSSLVKE